MKCVLPLAALLLTALAVVHIPGGGVDFQVDWLEMRALVDGLDPMAPLAALGAHYSIAGPENWADQFVAPRTPGVFAIMWPLGYLPWTALYWTGRALIGAAGFAMTWLLVRVSGVRWFWLTPGLFFLPPFAFVFGFGQSSFLLAACLLGAYLLLPDHPILAGLPLAVVVTFKLYPWLIPAALFAAGLWRVGLSTTAWLSGLNLGVALLPNLSLGAVVQVLRSGSRAADFEWNYSLLHFLGFSPLVGIALGMIFVAVCTQMDWRSAFLWSVPVSLLLAPIVWNHYLVLLLVPLAQITKSIFTPEPPVAAVLLDSPSPRPSFGRAPQAAGSMGADSRG